MAMFQETQSVSPNRNADLIKQYYSSWSQCRVMAVWTCEHANGKVHMCQHHTAFLVPFNDFYELPTYDVSRTGGAPAAQYRMLHSLLPLCSH